MRATEADVRLLLGTASYKQLAKLTDTDKVRQIARLRGEVAGLRSNEQNASGGEQHSASASYRYAQPCRQRGCPDLARHADSSRPVHKFQQQHDSPPSRDAMEF